MEQNPGIIIDHQAQPESNYYQLLLSAFSAESDLDVFLTHTDQRAWGIAESFYTFDDAIIDIIDTYADSALKACSETNSADSDIKILPLTAQGVGFYYNKANFKKAGLNPDLVPSDWDDFLDACSKLKRAGITPIIFGNQGSPFGIDFTYRAILGTLLSGEEIDGFADGSTQFTSPEFVQATEMIKRLYDYGYVNVTNASIPYFMDAINEFKNGNGGFFPGLTSDIAHWKDFGEALGYANIGYFPAPVADNAEYPENQVNQGAGIGFAVTEYSPHRDAAVKYAKFMTSGEAGKIFMDATGAIVPNSTIPVDSSNPMLTEVLNYMNGATVPDILNRVPGGMIQDFYNFMNLYFIANEISQEEYIAQVQNIYENNL
jgi:ABC-type glycerol-3-phosphate transport system substrate-binding protein